MASIKKLDTRKFKITVSNGYRPDGRKISRAKTIRSVGINCTRRAVSGRSIIRAGFFSMISFRLASLSTVVEGTTKTGQARTIYISEEMTTVLRSYCYYKMYEAQEGGFELVE